MAVSAFFAVLRDVTKLAAAAADDLAAQSVKLASAADDIALLTGKATAKTAGVAGDDLAVGAGQVSGVSPNRELPALWRITKGSAMNKVWLSALLLGVAYYVPLAISVALVVGALYLAFEGGESLLAVFHPEPEADEGEDTRSEDEKVKGAIRLDIVLSFEMLVIALASAGDAPLMHKIAVLALVGITMTVGVYGLIGLIIRLDDMGLALARSSSQFRQALGRSMVTASYSLRSVGSRKRFGTFFPFKGRRPEPGDKSSRLLQNRSSLFASSPMPNNRRNRVYLHLVQTEPATAP